MHAHACWDEMELMCEREGVGKERERGGERVREKEIERETKEIDRGIGFRMTNLGLIRSPSLNNCKINQEFYM